MLIKEQQIFEQIKKSKNILIVFPEILNNGNVANGLSLFLFLKKIGKKVDIIYEKNQTKQNEILSFLPLFDKIQNYVENLKSSVISLNIHNVKISKIKYNLDKETKKLNFTIFSKNGSFSNNDVKLNSVGFKHDLIITIGAPELELLGKIYYDNTEFFYKTNIINIDNNSNNEEFGQINFIDLSAVSIAEILFSFFKKYKLDDNNLIDSDIATCLLAGIIYSTKNFKTSNITPRVLLYASKLISLGARQKEIIDHLYRSRNVEVLKLWGKIFLLL